MAKAKSKPKAVEPKSGGLGWILLIALALYLVRSGGLSPVAPTPGPNDPAPVVSPTTGTYVLIVAEESGKDSDPWLSVLNSQVVETWLNSHCSKMPSGNPAWRKLDPHADMSNADPVWQAAMKVERQSVPWLLIAVNGKAYGYPLPKTEAEVMALLTKHGGA